MVVSAGTVSEPVPVDPLGAGVAEPLALGFGVAGRTLINPPIPGSTGVVDT